MIRYALVCEHEHGFEAWFGSSADYDAQAERGLVECPFCASQLVRKAIMSPAVAGTKRRGEPAQPPDRSAPPVLPEPSPEARTMMMEAMGRMRKHVEENFDYVGDRFAREARDIHDGVSEDRGIYGEATPKEVRDLVEDGIQVAPLPAAASPRPKGRVN